MLNKWTNQGAFNNLTHKITKQAREMLINLFTIIILSGICYIIISPLLGILSSSVMAMEDVFNPLIFLIPQNFTTDNLRHAFTYMNFVNTLTRTLIYVCGIATIHVIAASTIGYGFARFRFYGRNILFGLVIITIVIPVQTYIVPLFIQFRFFGPSSVNLLGSYWPMIILTAGGVGLRSGLFIYIFRQFFRGLPKEIEEAALIDGAGTFRTFLTVMIPNAIPAIITVFLFAFVWHYNDTFYSSLLMPGKELMSVQLTTLASRFSILENVVDPNAIQLVVFAGIVLVIAPILTIYMILQRHFIEGVERSGIVG